MSVDAMVADRLLWTVTALTLLSCQVGSVESVLCYFNYIDFYTANSTIRYEATECTECCGDPGYEYCCWEDDDSVMWVITVAVVSPIVLLTLIITIVVCCTVKLTLLHASRSKRAPPVIHTWQVNPNRHTPTDLSWCQTTSECSENAHHPRTGDPQTLPPVVNCPMNPSPNTREDVAPTSNSQPAATLPPI